MCGGGSDRDKRSYRALHQLVALPRCGASGAVAHAGVHCCAVPELRCYIERVQDSAFAASAGYSSKHSIRSQPSRRQPSRWRTSRRRCRCAPKSVMGCWMGHTYLTLAAMLQEQSNMEGVGASHERPVLFGFIGANALSPTNPHAGPSYQSGGRQTVSGEHLRNITSGGSDAYGARCSLISTLQHSAVEAQGRPGRSAAVGESEDQQAQKQRHQKHI